MAAPRYRDLQAPSLIDLGDRQTPTGAAEASQSIADTFASFSRAGSDVGGVFSAQVGAEQGAKDALVGVPKKKSALTAFGRSYSSAAEAGYYSRLQIDIAQTIDKIEQETPGDLESYTNRTEAYAKELLAEVPPEYQPELRYVLQGRIGAGDTRIRGQVIADTKNEAHAAFLESSNARASNALAVAEMLGGEEGDDAIVAAIQDNEAQLDALERDRVIDAVQRVKYAAAFAEDMDAGLSAIKTSGFVDDLMALARTNVQDGDDALATLEGRDDFSAEEKNAIRTAYRQERELLTFERSRQYVEQSGDLAQRLAGGAFGADVEAANADLYSKGALSVNEFEANRRAAQNNSEKKIKEEFDISAIVAAMQGGRGLDPTNKKQNAALDKMFVEGAKATGMAQGDARWTASALDIAKKTNVLPESAQSWARVNLLSGDPVQAAEAAVFITRVREANPVAWDFNNDPRTAAFSEQLMENATLGIDPVRSHEMAMKNVYQQTDAERKILNDRYNELKLDNPGKLQDKLHSDDTFDPNVFGGAPAAPLGMQAEYDSAVAQFYKFNGGNIEQAEKLAWDNVRARYGRTTVNGEPEIMKYAPSKMYPGMTDDVIRADIAGILESRGPMQQGYLDPASVRLKPIGLTEDTKGLLWQLQVMDADGNFDVLRDERNRPAIYSLPVGTAYEDARAAIAAGQLEEGKAKQAKLDAKRARRRGGNDKEVAALLKKGRY